MADVVGTAFVRIKALTDDLAKDIKKKVTKSLKDADLEKAGKTAGEDLGDGIADGASDTLKKRAKDFLPEDEFKKASERVTKNVRKVFGDIDFDDFDDRLHKAFEVDDRGPVSKFFSNLRDKFRGSDDDAGSWASRLRSHFRSVGDDDDGGGLSRFFQGLRDRFHDSADGAKSWASSVRTHFRSVGDDLDKDGSLSRSLGTLEKKLKGFGKDAAPNIGFLGKSIGLIVGAIAVALPAIQDLGSGILAYATGLVAQVGFLTTALIGLSAAAGAAIGAAGLAALPIMLAFKSETEALLEFKDAMTAAGEEFNRIGTATQATLLPALDDALFTLGDLVPMLSEFGLFVGQLAGSYARYAAEVLVSETAQGRLGAILQSSLRILDRLFPTLINVGNILSGIWVAAIPSAERLVDAIGDMVDRWSGMITVGLQTGELTRTLDLWYNRAQLVGSALGNLTGALFDILSVGADSADNVFVRFDQWAERFRSFTESEAGQNRLALIFENSLAVMREINAVAAELFEGIFGRLDNVGGVDTMVAALQRFRDVLPEIKEVSQDVIDAIDKVVKLLADAAWDRAKEAWEALADPLGRLADQTLRLMEAMSESGAFEVFLELMRILTDTLSVLFSIPGFGTFIAYFIAFNSALKISKIVLGPFVGILGSFVGVFKQLIAINAAGAAAGVGQGLGRIAAGAKAITAANTASTLAGVGGAAGGAVTKAGGLATTISVISSGLKTLGPYGIAAGIGIGAVGVAFFNNRRRAQEWQQEIRQATEALGLLNDGLNITAEGITKYIDTTSAFESNDQIDDLVRLGYTVDSLGEHLARGVLTIEDFVDKALKMNEISIIGTEMGSTGQGLFVETANSLDELQEKYRLTDEAVRKLADGESVRSGTVDLTLGDNVELIDSFKEVTKVIGAAAKESIDEFVTNTTNLELLGGAALNGIKDDIEGASDEEAGRKMAEAMDRLGSAATEATSQVTGLSEETRNLILTEAAGADGIINTNAERVKSYELTRDALSKQNEEIKRNLDLFASTDFENQFGGAKAAVLNFSELVENTDFSALYVGIGDNVDALTEKFPRLGDSTLLLFDQLKNLPAAEFDAAAEAMGVSADTLRAAMESTNQAIKDLQDQAVASLPTVGELLRDATSVNEEDGSQAFDKEGFMKAVTDRINTTKNFAGDIKKIQEESGDAAARVAAQQGPEAAKHLATIIGTDADQLDATLRQMEEAERILREQIKTTLGPGIAAEYSVTSGLIGDAWGGGIASGINSPEVQEALKTSSMDALNYLARGFQGHFVIENNILKFKYTGEFIETRRRRRPNLQDRGLFAAGGLVPNSVKETFSRSFGTDTVPAMLTPGEFVNTRSTVDRLGVDFFNSLNNGLTPAVPVPTGGGTSIDARGWTVVAPNPEESGRQIVSRFRSLSFLMGEN